MSTVTITISNDGTCSVRFDPPAKKNGQEFRQVAAALCCTRSTPCTAKARKKARRWNDGPKKPRNAAKDDRK